VANALAAAAACRAAGFSAKDIRRGLATFTPAEVNPGRGNVYRAGDDQPVIVDYGHNAAALDATGAMITKVWGGEPAAAVTLPGDRRDDLVTETAEAIAAWFGKVVVYEDDDKRGRRPGEMQELIEAAMRRVRPDIICARASGPQQALRHALALADGAPILFLYEKFAAARAAVASIGAEPWPGKPAQGSAVSQTPLPWPGQPAQGSAVSQTPLPWPGQPAQGSAVSQTPLPWPDADRP
jgi:cyanophycin synthetase